jgi:hypothetical protein
MLWVVNGMGMRWAQGKGCAAFCEIEALFDGAGAQEVQAPEPSGQPSVGDEGVGVLR